MRQSIFATVLAAGLAFGAPAQAQSYPGGPVHMIVGYAAGYRASWDAASGRVTPAVLEDNRKAWCGDHCVDPPLVPGVLFSNLRMTADNPGIEDLAPTALSLFGVEAPAWMEGKPVIATS